MKPLRICLDARLPSGDVGGIAQVVMGMACGVSQLTDGDEEYLFLADHECDSWVSPYIGGNCRMLYTPVAPHRDSRRHIIDSLPGLRVAWDRFSPMLLGARSFKVPVSDGTIERAGVDLMHFLFPRGFMTTVPSIYHPHDLQHRHYPAFFSPRARMTRDILMSAMCQQARMVAVVSTWIKQDLIFQYGLPEEKISIISLAPSNETYPSPAVGDLANIRAKYGLPDAFVLFPARPFAHKNHLRLLDAMALLRDRHGITVPLVSCGQPTEFLSVIKKHVSKLRLDNQVHFLGFVSSLELQCLYSLCRCMVFPSKFEAASFPIWDAFLAGVPVACSNVTSLPQQVGDAALIFDPDDALSMANAIERLWTTPLLCNTLVERGRANVARFTWRRTARHFRAHYRRILGHPLDDDDMQLLSSPPLM